MRRGWWMKSRGNWSRHSLRMKTLGNIVFIWTSAPLLRLEQGRSSDSPQLFTASDCIYRNLLVTLSSDSLPREREGVKRGVLGGPAAPQTPPAYARGLGAAAPSRSPRWRAPVPV